MGTDRKITAVKRNRTPSATRSTTPGDAAGTAGAAHGEGTTLQRRFRRGRWTVTALPL